MQCGAACTSIVRASGEIEIPADEPRMLVTLCVNDECHDSQLSFDDAGTGTCSYGVDCELEGLEGGGAHLTLKCGEFQGGIAVGDEIRVTVQVMGTGEKLVDAAIEVTSVGESTTCGMTCNSAIASWDE